MPLDALCLRAVVEELRPRLTGARIDKVQQPARDQVILLRRGNKRLLLNAGAGSPRIQLTEQLRPEADEIPAEAEALMEDVRRDYRATVASIRSYLNVA